VNWIILIGVVGLIFSAIGKARAAKDNRTQKNIAEGVRNALAERDRQDKGK
jgi:hypothetical protein